MRRIFLLTMLVALSLGIVMGMGVVGAQETENETSNGTAIEWPTDPENVSVEDTRDALEEQPDKLPRESVTAIVQWLSDRENIEELGASERERLSGWLVDARSIEANLPEVPDFGGDRDGGDQEDDDRGNRADSELEDETANETIPANASTGFANQEMIAFNDETRIVGWEFRDGTIRVALHTDRRAGVTVSDALAGIGEKGAVQVPETNQFLERNETTIVQMDVSEFNGGQSVGVTVDGMTVRLSSEMDDEDDNPLRYFGGEQGLMFGMAMSVVMSGGAAGFVLWREETGVIKA